MIKVDVNGCSPFVDAALYESYVKKALDAFDVLKEESGEGNDFLGWKKLPRKITDRELNDYEAIRDKWARKGVDLVIAIGIGGSYLGAKCVMEALSHNFSKQLKRKDAAEVVFAGNNLSEEYLAELMDLAAERNTACIVISKSGTTTEPALAFRVFKKLVEDKYGKEEAKNHIFATTDKAKGTLKELSDTEGYETFVVPDDVGGRFSVLTAVGLLPIAVAGCDIDKLMEGAAKAQADYTADFDNNDCYKYAALRNIFYRKGKSVNWYIDQAGGFSNKGKKSQTYIIYMNGTVAKAGHNAKPEPGCEIVVPAKPLNKMTLTETLSIATGVGSLAAIIATLASLLK